MRTLFYTAVLAVAALVAAPALAQERNEKLYRPFTIDGQLVQVPSELAMATWKERCGVFTGLKADSCAGNVYVISSTWERAVNARASKALVAILGNPTPYAIEDPDMLAKQAYDSQLRLQREMPELFK